jgi:hypothetical protein
MACLPPLCSDNSAAANFSEGQPFEGKSIRTFGSGQLSNPYEMAGLGDELWILNTAGATISVYNSEYKLLRTVGSRGTGNGQLTNPCGLLVTETEVFVADPGEGRKDIQVFSRFDFKFLRKMIGVKPYGMQMINVFVPFSSKLFVLPHTLLFCL